MAKRRYDVTDAELAVLQVFWDQGSATIRQLTDALYPGGSAAHYATVQKLLERLEAKDYVRRRRQSPAQLAHLFEATVDRDGLIGRLLEQMADKLCGGSLTPLLTNLTQAARSRRLTARERQELRTLIDQLDKRKQ
jgi:predicted transcriptional regulator